MAVVASATAAMMVTAPIDNNGRFAGDWTNRIQLRSYSFYSQQRTTMNRIVLSSSLLSHCLDSLFFCCFFALIFQMCIGSTCYPLLDAVELQCRAISRANRSHVFHFFMFFYPKCNMYFERIGLIFERFSLCCCCCCRYCCCRDRSFSQLPVSYYCVAKQWDAHSRPELKSSKNNNNYSHNDIHFLFSSSLFFFRKREEKDGKNNRLQHFSDCMHAVSRRSLSFHLLPVVSEMLEFSGSVDRFPFRHAYVCVCCVFFARC